MTADEIRKMYLDYADMNDQAKTNEGAHVVAEEAAVHMLFEIAAQLAELNRTLRSIEREGVAWVSAELPANIVRGK